MGAIARRGCLVAVVCCGLLPSACGGSTDEPAARQPVPAPPVALSAEDREIWAPLPSGRPSVPVLLYHGVAPAAFARHMALLDQAGYETITLDELVRFVEREQVSLPPHPCS